MKHLIALLFTITLGISNALADIDTDISNLQSRWAEINYQLEGKAQLSAFEQLMADAEAVTRSFPDRAEAWIWKGIIESTYAGAKGGLGALSLARAAKADLEKALEIDDTALNGSAYTSLGSLYYSVPGWPVGFGNDEKAETMLRQALAINPDGIDSNYFYADFLIDQSRYSEAREYLNRARKAPSRPGRQLADSGRQREIADALAAIAKK